MKVTRADSRRWAAKDAGAKPSAGVPKGQTVHARGSNRLGRAGSPPVYMPYNQPAQMKPGSATGNSVLHAAPPVYKPAQAKVSAPSVYRPNVSLSLQRKPGILPPPVYRPQPAFQQQKRTISASVTPGPHLTQGVNPPLNQPPANLQRMPFAQVPASTAPPRAAGLPFSGVAQPAGCCTAVGNCLGAVWNSIASCFTRPTQHQAIPLDESGDLTTIQVDTRKTDGETHWVMEGTNTINLDYPSTVHGGYISSCALVIFCGDDSFDCYHAKGGGYNQFHGMMRNPTQIYFVYMATPYDTDTYVQDYRDNADRYRRSGGNAPMQFMGQTGVKNNVMVRVRSADEIEPYMGEFV